jgi:hypothetical protein
MRAAFLLPNAPHQGLPGAVFYGPSAQLVYFCLAPQPKAPGNAGAFNLIHHFKQ